MYIFTIMYLKHIINKPMDFTNDDKKNIKGFAAFLLSLSPNEFAALASLLGLLFSQNLDYYSQQSVGNFLECIGQVMLTTSAQGFALNQAFSNNNNSNQNSN